MDGSMIAAIRARKQKSAAIMGDHEATHQQNHEPSMDEKPGQEMDAQHMVSQMSEEQKHHLRTALEKDKQGDNSQGVAKGGPSSEEKGKIAQASADEDKQNAMEMAEDADRYGDNSQQGPAVDSDAIGKSMLDSKFRNGAPEGFKPRNLGERVKMTIANKLKGKGKL